MHILYGFVRLCLSAIFSLMYTECETLINVIHSIFKAKSIQSGLSCDIVEFLLPYQTVEQTIQTSKVHRCYGGSVLAAEHYVDWLGNCTLLLIYSGPLCIYGSLYSTVDALYSPPGVCCTGLVWVLALA